MSIYVAPGSVSSNIQRIDINDVTIKITVIDFGARIKDSRYTVRSWASALELIGTATRVRVQGGYGGPVVYVTVVR